MHTRYSGMNLRQSGYFYEVDMVLQMCIHVCLAVIFELPEVRFLLRRDRRLYHFVNFVCAKMQSGKHVGFGSG